jgi:tetratricopeptide (TPR) repeat protein
VQSNLESEKDLLNRLKNCDEEIENKFEKIKKNGYGFRPFMDKAKVLEKLNRFEEALDVYEEILKITENDLHALRLKTELLYKMKKYNEVLETTEIIIKILANRKNEADTRYYITKTQTLLDLERFEEAENCLDKMLELDELYPFACLEKAWLKFYDKNFDEADLFVDKILSKYPDHPPPLYKNTKYAEALSLKNEIKLGRKGESMQDLVEKSL